MSIITRYISILALLLTANLQFVHANTDIIVDEAWIREGPPSATVLAGYMHIKNISSRNHTLIKVSSPEFATIEMHESIEKDGFMRMQKHTKIPISARDTLVFAPSGFHLMLMDPKVKIKAGMKVVLIFEFQELNAPVTANAIVKRVID